MKARLRKTFRYRGFTVVVRFFPSAHCPWSALVRPGKAGRHEETRLVVVYEASLKTALRTIRLAVDRFFNEGTWKSPKKDP